MVTIGGVRVFLDITPALRAPGQEITLHHRDAVPPQTVFGEEIAFEDVRFEGAYSLTGDTLRLSGTFRARALGHCAGCLRPVVLGMEVPFDEVFTRLDRFRPQETPQQDEDDERLMFEGSKVELSHLALTLAVLELPMRFVCGDDCQALRAMQPEESPITHACQKDMPDQHPFSALQQLLTKDQEV